MTLCEITGGEDETWVLERDMCGGLTISHHHEAHGWRVIDINADVLAQFAARLAEPPPVVAAQPDVMALIYAVARGARP